MKGIWKQISVGIRHAIVIAITYYSNFFCTAYTFFEIIALENKRGGRQNFYNIIINVVFVASCLVFIFYTQKNQKIDATSSTSDIVCRCCKKDFLLHFHFHSFHIPIVELNVRMEYGSIVRNSKKKQTYTPTYKHPHLHRDIKCVLLASIY